MTTPTERSTNNRRQRRKINIKWAQAFKQAPWRGQIQSAGLFLLGLVVVIVVASIYLSISGRAASAGLGAYRMSAERQTLERQIADRKARIAVLQLDEARDILQYIESELKRIPLCDVRCALSRIEGRNPRAIGMTAAGKARFWIDHVAIILRALAKHGFIAVLAQRLGQFSKHKVIVGIVQRARHLFVMVRQRR